METKVLGEAIKDRRKIMNLTQKELGKLIGKTESSIQKYESGTTEIPLSVLGKIAHHLGVEITDFLDTKSVMSIESARENSLLNYLNELGYKISDDPENASCNIVYYNGYHYRVPFEILLWDVLDAIRFQSQYAMDRVLEKAEKID